MGYTPSFNGENYHNKKVYGSEITAIKLAEALSNNYNVYCPTFKDIYSVV